MSSLVRRVNTLVNLFTISTYGCMIVYSFKYLPRGQGAASMFNQIFTALIGVSITISSFPGKPMALKRFPWFGIPNKIIKVWIMWYLTIGIFVISDPVFFNSKKNKNNDKFRSSVYYLMAVLASFCLLCFVFNCYALWKFGGKDKDKDKDTAASAPSPASTTSPAAPTAAEPPAVAVAIAMPEPDAPPAGLPPPITISSTQPVAEPVQAMPMPEPEPARVQPQNTDAGVNAAIQTST